MSKPFTLRTPRQKRHARIRARVIGTATQPRLSVYRSNRAVYAQLIDDSAGHTIAAADSRKSTAGSLQTQAEAAEAVGAAIAQAAKTAGITKVIFDRGGFKYHGTVKAVAESARSGGLQF